LIKTQTHPKGKKGLKFIFLALKQTELGPHVIKQSQHPNHINAGAIMKYTTQYQFVKPEDQS
jgi:Zn/Cd-binding protein ZinT